MIFGPYQPQFMVWFTVELGLYECYVLFGKSKVTLLL